MQCAAVVFLGDCFVFFYCCCYPLVAVSLESIFFFRTPWATGSDARLKNLSTKVASDACEDELLISDSCVKRLKEITEDGSCLRVTVEGGGCSGFQYKFNLDSNVNEDDK